MIAVNMSLKYKIVLFYIILINFQSSLFAQKEMGGEYNLKATFIYHFTKYIKWTDSDSTKDFKIAILGDSDIITPLKKIANMRTVNNRKILIKHFNNIQDIDTCQILFISASKKNELQVILKKAEHKNILTISDSKGFAHKGVAINFVISEGKIKFEINNRALKRTGLQVSSQLQKLAILVEEEEI
jgi:hypothetical protein